MFIRLHKLILCKFRKITPAVCAFHPKRFCFQTFLSPSSGKRYKSPLMYLYTKVKYQKIALIANCFTLIVEQFFRFDRVDIREESFLKKLACLGMPFYFIFLFFLIFFYFSFSFLNSWIQNYSALHNIKQNISAQSSFHNLWKTRHWFRECSLDRILSILTQVTLSYEKLRNQTLLLSASRHFRWTIPISNG